MKAGKWKIIISDTATFSDLCVIKNDFYLND
jgi:hypothetical protein